MNAHAPDLQAPISAQALLDRQFTPVRWPVPELISEGLTILAGAPRSGKTTFCLDLALGVAGGTAALNTMDVEAGDVLYLALEEPLRRLHERLRRLLQHNPVPARLDIVSLDHDFPPLTQDGRGRLEHWIDAHPDARLVVVDTLRRWTRRPGRRDKQPTAIPDDIASLAKLARERKFALLVVHNARAAGTAEAVRAFDRAFGLDGLVDGVLLLKRTHSKVDALLSVSGRDLEDQELLLFWGPGDLCWSNMGPAADVSPSFGRELIIDTLKAEGHPLTPRELFDILQTDYPAAVHHPAVSYNALRQRMFQMCRVGLLETCCGRHWLPGVPVPPCGEDDEFDDDDGGDDNDDPNTLTY